MIVAGIGCRRGVGADEVVAAVDAGLAGARLGRARLDALATAGIKRDEQGIAEAGRALSLPVIVVGDADLHAADARCLTRSEASLATAGVASVAEAAALAAAGSESVLVAPRIVLGRVTCAIASGGGVS